MFRSLKFKLWLVLFASAICNSSPANDHLILDQVVEFQNPKIRRFDLARDLALTVYETTTDESAKTRALRLYVLNAVRTGFASTAIDYSEELIDREPTWYNQAKHVDVLLHAGYLERAKVLANDVWDHQSEWDNADNRNQIIRFLDSALTRKYYITFNFIPERLNLLPGISQPYHIPVPMNNFTYQTADNVWNNVTRVRRKNRNSQNEFLEITPISDQVNFQVHSEVTVKTVDLISKCRQATWTKTKNGVDAKYLAETHYINFGDPVFDDLANELHADTPFDQVKKVCDYCSQNIRYTPKGASNTGIRTASEVFDREFGHCVGQSTIAVALLRKKGIPARLIRGHSAFTGDGDNVAMVNRYHHTLVEFYLNSVGWVKWDYYQTPGIVHSDFLSLWVYDHPNGGIDPAQSTDKLHSIQKLGLDYTEDDVDVLAGEQVGYAEVQLLERRRD